METTVLYDLAGADERQRWSPFCWRVKLALAHKRVPVSTVPWHYFQKEVLAPSMQGDIPRVPTMVENGRWLTDSWRIALHLDERYADRPALFRGADGRRHALFIKHWVESALHPHLIRITLYDMYRRLHPLDQPYFRQSREQRYGMSLEAFSADRATHVTALRAALEPVRRTLGDAPFLGGEVPDFCDYLVVASLLWGAEACQCELLDATDSVAAWRDRILARYDDVLKAFPC